MSMVKLKKLSNIKFVLIGIIILALAGCMGSKAPPRHAYMFRVHYPARQKAASRNAVLQVLTTQVLPQFAGGQMVYRMTDLNYESDYYNIFFIPPGQQITQILTHWFRSRRIAKDVVTNSLLNVNYILQSTVQALYADYRSNAAPRAVIKMRFTLYQQMQYKRRIVLEKTFYSRIAIHRHDTQGLMRAYNNELNVIMSKLTKQVYKVMR